MRTVDDFAFLHAATPPPAPPYAVVIPTTLFTRANIMPLQLSPHVGGILLVRNTTAPDPVHYTHELQCPNQYSAYNAESCAAPNRTAQPDDAEVWNPDGTGMLHETFPFPIYYLDDEPQIRTVIECYERFNAAEPGAQAQRSLCSVQIDQFMASAVNSETCLRRSGYELTMKPTHYCDALMGKNVFATLFPRDTRSEQPATAGDPPATEAAAPAAAAAPEQFILVTARLDTASMFDGLGAGASEVLPFVALLSAAHTLATLLPERLAAAGAAPVALQPNVLFMIFNGEAYDYIGSQRFVYDLRRGNFPPAYQHRAVIRPEAVQLVIDVAGLDAGNASALHAYHVRDFPRATQLLSALDKYNSALGLGVATVDRRQAAMPAPSSVHSFLRDNATWPTVVLRAPTRNRYLHSVYDAGAAVRFAYANTSADFERLDDVRVAPAAFAADSVQMGVRNVSTLLALTLYELVTGRPNDGWLGANAVLVDELLYCYLNATRCRLMIAAVAPSLGAQMVGSAPVPPLRYISVQAYASEAVSLTYALLGLLVGRRTNETEARCKELPSLQWMGGANGTGECRLGTQNLSAAISPAFTMAGRDCDGSACGGLVAIY